MTNAEKALQYFIIAVPEDKEQAEAYFWAWRALNAAIRAERAVGESMSLLTNADLLARAEAAEALVHELETTHRTEMCSDGYDCVQLRKARKAVADAEARAEKAEKERDAAVEDMRGICYLCANAKPYSEFSQRMMTCEHIKAVASTKSPGCKHFKWRGQKEE